MSNSIPIIGQEKSHVGMANCYFCGEPSKVLLETRITRSLSGGPGELMKSLPRDCGVVDMDPCSSCEELMKVGVILITVKPESFDEIERDRQEWLADENPEKKPFFPNPYRTGGWFVVRDDMLERMKEDVPDSVVDNLLRRRWGFISHEDAELLGLFDAKPVYQEVSECIKQGQDDQPDEQKGSLILPN